MGEKLAFVLGIVFISIGMVLTMQEDYFDLETSPPEFRELADGKYLKLNQSYCLNEIGAKTISNKFFGYQNRSAYYIEIKWSSNVFMTSIKVESDSVNDSYCEAENKHFYCRTPLNQTFHIFPDEVHDGIRFLPIKLDCKYIITPELDGMCRPLKLRYSTPACLDYETCTCRNVNMPGPILDGSLEENGVKVSWVFPRDFRHKIKSIVISIYLEDGINIRKVLKRKVDESGSSATNKQYFQTNISSQYVYRIVGYFENKINCPGNSTFILLRRLEVPPKEHHQTAVVYTMVFILSLLITILTAFYFWKKSIRKICVKIFFPESSNGERVDDFGQKDILLPPMVWNPSYAEQCRDPYLFDFRDLVIIREIASGNFGIVYLAYSPVSLRGCNNFAIKQIKDKAGSEGVTDFTEEINIFKLVGDHPNVVKMYGYCPRPLTIIMEYVPFNLLTYLKNLRVRFDKKRNRSCGSVSYAQLAHSRNSSASDYNYISSSEVETHEYETQELTYVLDKKELETFGLQIARGMEHLESKNIVHRDLAARNVLVDAEKVLKISDFGMSKKGIYVNKTSKKFPLRWMSPEALVDRIYTNKSDVWSFGVVLWEIGTLGAFPYPTLQNEEVITLLKKGGHLEKPENVTDELYSVMVKCWTRNPEERPTFKELVEKLEGHCLKSNGYVEFENLESNYVFPPMEEDVDLKINPT